MEETCCNFTVVFIIRKSFFCKIFRNSQTVKVFSAKHCLHQSILYFSEKKIRYKNAIVMSDDFSTAIDARCGTTNTYTGLIVFSVSSVAFLMVLSIPLNALVVFVLIKDRKQKRYKSLFYKLLLNIAVADLLTGLVSYPSAVNALTKEAFRIKVSKAEVYLVHLSLFFTDAVALCTLTLLSVDRIVAILSPVKHFKGMKQTTRYVLVVCTWIIGFCLVLPYVKLKFIRQLFIFSTINIAITVLSLIVTIVVYRLKLKSSASIKQETDMSQVVVRNLQTELADERFTFTETAERKAKNKSADNVFLEPEDNSATTTSKNPFKLVSNNAVVKIEKFSEETNTKTVKISGTQVVGAANRSSGDNFISKRQARNQQKATRTFLIMLCVFVLTYLPTAVTMIFMNVCTTCDCLAIHVMRDVSIISILSSSVFRPLNFILTLKHLRTSVFLKLRIKKRQGKDNTVVSGTNESKVTSDTSQ